MARTSSAHKLPLLSIRGMYSFHYAGHNHGVLFKLIQPFGLETCVLFWRIRIYYTGRTYASGSTHSSKLKARGPIHYHERNQYHDSKREDQQIYNGAFKIKQTFLHPLLIATRTHIESFTTNNYTKLLKQKMDVYFYINHIRAIALTL